MDRPIRWPVTLRERLLHDCPATLHLGDWSFYCDRPAGHSGQHHERGVNGYAGWVTEWEEAPEGEATKVSAEGRKLRSEGE